MPRKSKVSNEKEKFSEEDVYAEEDRTHDFNVPKTSDEIKSEMEAGKEPEEVYTEEGREKLIEDAEIEDWEEGYMEGAEGRGEQSSCAYCGKLLGEEEKEIVERRFDGEIKWFCSVDHAQKYAEREEKNKKKRAAEREEK